MIVTVNPKLTELCEEYERRRAELVASSGEATAAIPPILTVVLLVVPIVLRAIQSGKFDLAAIRDILDLVLPTIGVPPELIALAKQIIDLLIGGLT